MASSAPSAQFRPLVCADLELSGPVAPEVPEGGGIAFLVRLHGEPLGELVIEPEAVAKGTFGWVNAAFSDLRDRVVEHLTTDLGTAPEEIDNQTLRDLIEQNASDCHCVARPAEPAPTAVLAVCTMGKHHLLPRCLQALLNQDYPGEFTVLVVDNAPASGAAEQVVAGFDDPRLKLVPQPIPGLSFARNKAIETASAMGAELLLFTDDDAIADPRWLPSKAATFQQDRKVGIVTGLIVPGSLASAAEQLFEEGSGFNKGYRRTVWSMAPVGDPVWALGERGHGGPLFPFAAGSFGSGNSLGFRLSSLQKLHGFDEALGAGTPTAGGEDLDVFVRALIGGQTIIYEPRAVVRHYHRETYADLRKQMVGYGSGLSAFLFRELLFAPHVRAQLLKAVPRGVKFMFDPYSGKNVTRTREYPEELVKVERVGFIKGPWLYLKSRRRSKKLAAGGQA